MGLKSIGKWRLAIVRLALFSLECGCQENEEEKMGNSTLMAFSVRCLWMICLVRKQQNDASGILFIGDAMPHTDGIL